MMNTGGVTGASAWQPIEGTKKTANVHIPEHGETFATFSEQQINNCTAGCVTHSPAQITAQNAINDFFNHSQVSLAKDIVEAFADQPDDVKLGVCEGLAQLKVATEKAGDVSAIKKELFDYGTTGNFEAFAKAMPSIDSIQGEVENALPKQANAFYDCLEGNQ